MDKSRDGCPFARLWLKINSEDRRATMDNPLLYQWMRGPKTVLTSLTRSHCRTTTYYCSIVRILRSTVVGLIQKYGLSGCLSSLQYNTYYRQGRTSKSLTEDTFSTYKRVRVFPRPRVALSGLHNNPALPSTVVWCGYMRHVHRTQHPRGASVRPGLRDR